MTIAWVLGSRGLLGSALCRVLRFKGTELFFPAESFRWNSEPDLVLQFSMALQAFSEHLAGSRRWEIYWAAGVGTMSSSEADLALETRALTILLRLIESTPQLITIPGAVAFASSAGAIYAGSPDYTISENTMPAPTTAYAREKIRQEELIRSFVQANENRTALLARLSTVYGPGQSSNKRQGLLAHIARCILRNQPMQIYVPLDTIRDYINADDAATSMILALRAISDSPGALIKIIASEQPTTIAEIISIFKRITRRAPRIVTSAGNLTSIYSRRMQFRSIAIPQIVESPKTSLLAGIAKIMAAERAAYVCGSSVPHHRRGGE